METFDLNIVLRLTRLQLNLKFRQTANPTARVKRERDDEYEELLATAKSKRPRVKKEIEVIDLLDD